MGVCTKSPFFHEEQIIGSIAKKCPFHLAYKYDDDEEEYYLDCYDEMHNHVLT